MFSFLDFLVTVFPNPEKNQLSVKAFRLITKVEIFSRDGLLIESLNRKFESLKSGMYFVKVHFVNSQQTIKFIKQ